MSNCLFVVVVCILFVLSFLPSYRYLMVSGMSLSSMADVCNPVTYCNSNIYFVITIILKTPQIYDYPQSSLSLVETFEYFSF